MEYAYNVKKETVAGMLENSMYQFMTRRGYFVDEENTLLLPRKDHRSAIFAYLRSKRRSEEDAANFLAWCRKTQDHKVQAGVESAFRVFNSDLASRKALIDKAKIDGVWATYSSKVKITMQRLAMFALVDYKALNQRVKQPNLLVTNLSNVIRPMSSLEAIEHKKLFPANGGVVVTVHKSSLALFAPTKLQFPPIAPENNVLVLSHIVKAFPHFDHMRFLMVCPSVHSFATRVQQYNQYAVRQPGMTAESFIRYRNILREEGIFVDETLKFSSIVDINPQSVCYGVAKYTTPEDKVIDLSKGLSYGTVGKYAREEVIDFANQRHSVEVMDKIKQTSNQIKGTVKMEVLRTIPDEEGLLDTKLPRTFFTGQSCMRLAQQMFLQPFAKMQCRLSNERRARGLRASSICGTTFNTGGILRILAYLATGNSSSVLTFAHLMHFHVCADRRRMEMTTAAIARAVLWSLVRSAFGGLSKQYAFLLRWVISCEQKPVYATFSAGNYHLVFTNLAVKSGEPATYLIDNIDNANALHRLCDLFKFTFVNGGDDAWIDIGDGEQYDDLMMAMDSFQKNHGIIWTDRELRKVCVIVDTDLEKFRNLEAVSVVNGREGDMVSAWGINEGERFCQIYGHTPVVVVNSDMDIVGAFPVYKIERILCSWYQPSKKGEGMSADVQASIRAIGMNAVLGMFYPINYMFREWVDMNPLPLAQKVDDFLGEFAIEGKPKVFEKQNVVWDSDTVFYHWYNEGAVPGMEPEPVEELPNWEKMYTKIDSIDGSSSAGFDWAENVEESDEAVPHTFVEQVRKAPAYETLTDSDDFLIAVAQFNSMLAKASDKDVQAYMKLPKRGLRQAFGGIKLNGKEIRDLLIVHSVSKFPGAVLPAVKDRDGVFELVTKKGQLYACKFEGSDPPKTMWFYIIGKNEALAMGYPDEIVTSLGSIVEKVPGGDEETWTRQPTSSRTIKIRRRRGKDKHSRIAGFDKQRKLQRDSKGRKWEEVELDDDTEIFDDFADDDY
jgi:hypothetical protein